MLFVGLMNIDLCFIGLNIEMGLIICSLVLLDVVVKLFDELVCDSVYWVINDDGYLCWIIYENGKEVVVDYELEVGLGCWMWIQMLVLFILEELLQWF